MTDKEQIMVDGVDVSECLFYQSNFEEDYDVKIKHFCSNWHNSCESVNNSNCYFKQFARKTQECEQKDKEINELHLIIDRLLEASGYDKNISSAEDFEDVYADIDYKLGLLDELKQECEQKEKELKELKRQYKLSCLDCEYKNTKADVNRYRKALEEIEEIVTQDRNIKDVCLVSTCFKEDRIMYDIQEEILNIINKAKGEEDE